MSGTSSLRGAGRRVARCLLLAGRASAPDVQFTDVTQAVGHRLHARELRHLEQVPDRDDGRRRGAARLRQRRPARHLLHERREARRPDAAGKRPDKSDPRFWNRLYHQNADGTFTDVTEKAGLTGMPQNRYGMGVGGRATTTTTASPISTSPATAATRSTATTGTARSPTSPAAPASAAGGWSASAGFFDYDNDGKLDLFVTRYVEWSFREQPLLRREEAGLPRLLPPRQLRRHDQPPVPQQRRRHVHRRLREGRHRRSAGQGARASRSPTTTTTASSTSTSPTIRCSRFLFHNNGNGTFTEVGLLAGVGFNEDGKTFAGMGVDFADYDNDGRPDIVVTDLSNERYLLFRQNGDGSFRDVTNAIRRGRRDAAVLRLEHALLRLRQRRLEGPLRRAGARDGHDREDRAEPEVPAAAAAAAQRVRPLRRGCLPARPSRQDWAGRGAAFGDLDNDGDVDVVVSNVGQSAVVLRNDGGNRGHWLRDPDASARGRTATASAAA